MSKYKYKRILTYAVQPVQLLQLIFTFEIGPVKYKIKPQHSVKKSLLRNKCVKLDTCQFPSSLQHRIKLSHIADKWISCKGDIMVSILLKLSSFGSE